jgi:2,4-dienoyl-CoA reductase-like NADH-dependent reductase (Old Yellow Enzyme family)
VSLRHHEIATEHPRGKSRPKAGITIATLGSVNNPQEADAIIRSGRADMVWIGREQQPDLNWPAWAQRELSPEGISPILPV